MTRDDADERDAAWDAYYQLTYLASVCASPRELFAADDDA